MGKIIIGLIVAYLLYYIGMIAYDLYLKKEKIKEEDKEQEFLVDLGEKNREIPKNIEIDDVENINTPKSFQNREIDDFENHKYSDEEIEEFRRKFEEEEDLEGFDVQREEKPQTAEEKKEELRRKVKEDFKNFIKEAEIEIQMISNEQGHKVYDFHKKVA